MEIDMTAVQIIKFLKEFYKNNNPEIKDSNKEEYEEIIGEVLKTIKKLKKKEPQIYQKILEIDSYNISEEEKNLELISVCDLWLKKNTLKSLPGNKYYEWYKKGIDFFMEKMNEELIYHSGLGLFLHKQEKFKLTKENTVIKYYKKFNIKYKLEESKTKRLDFFNIWLTNIRRKDIREIVLKPNQKVDKSLFNLWEGYDYKKTGKPNLDKIKSFLDHIKHVWASDNAQTYNYILNWFAQIIQTPEKKTKACLVLKSIEGVGKTIVLELIGKIMGNDYYLSTSSLESILGKFNKCAEGKILINFNETNWGGDKKLTGNFKTLITDHTMKIEDKNISDYYTDNLLNFIITTNEDWIVNISANDRRFYLIECNSIKYNKKYYKDIVDTDINELANFFYERNIKDFDSTKIEFTKLKQEQIIENFNSVENFLYNIYNEDISLDDIIIEKDYNDDSEISILKNNFYELYISNTTGSYNAVVNNIKFWKLIRKILPTAFFIKASRDIKPKIAFPSFISFKKEFQNYSKTDGSEI